MVEICLHAANLFYLASFLGRDMLWLRTLTCVGLILGVVFFSCQVTPMYGPTAWHVVFLAINVVQIRQLVRERRRLRLTRKQEQFGAAAFRDHSRDELLALLTRATCGRPDVLEGIPQALETPLTRDEKALRDLAFSHLTRQELMNLLTRRAWASLRGRGTSRWKRSRSAAKRAASESPELGAAPSSLAG